MVKKIHTILIVDDDDTNLLILEKVLRPKYSVITSASGEEALEILRTKEISLLITDQRMPGMTGTELLRESQQIRPNMIMMLLTSNHDTGTYIDAVKSKALRVITKPWDRVELLALVEDSVQRYENLVKRMGSIDRLKRMNERMDKIANSE